MRVSVLVVDDDPDFRVLATRLLASVGLDVVGEAGSCADALAAARAARPAAVLVDVGLPDGDGRTLSRELAALEFTPRVLLTSSDPDAVGGDDVARAGAVGFVAKADLPDAALRALLGGE